jgi:hypothetical protein
MKKIILITLLGLGIFLGLFLLSPTAVTFQSLESVTEDGKPIFNQIKFIAGWDKDIWIMRQSHIGYHKDYKAWDRLAIIVDKTKFPYQAKFYQYSPSELDIGGQQVPYKARCYACHVSGPRTILPNYESTIVKPNLKDKLQVAIWNLRIKSYGPAQSIAGHQLEGGVPFQSSLPLLSKPLGLESCTTCHSKKGIRNELKIEHLGTARFLVKEGLMPPFPFTITEKEKENLYR